MFILTIHFEEGYEPPIKMYVDGENSPSNINLISIIKGLKTQGYVSYTLMDDAGAFYALSAFLSNEQIQILTRAYKYVPSMVILTEGNKQILNVDPDFPVIFPIN